MHRLLTAALLLLGLLPGRDGAARTQMPMNNDSLPFIQIFPQGEPLPEPVARYFVGQAYLHRLVSDATLGVPVANVTFEPACRNNWHSHMGGQLLVCTAGRGYYQEQGRPARALRPGDVVEIAPDVVHWHGAAPDSWFSHLAVECHPETNVNTWLGPVDDAQYAAAVGALPAAETVGRSPFAADDPLRRSDPELVAICEAFAADEAPRCGALDDRRRAMALLAACVAGRSEGMFRRQLDAALDSRSLSPLEIREVVYHAVPYVGMAAAVDFVRTADEAFAARGVALPLPDQSTVAPDDRLARGRALQVAIFGEAIGRMGDALPADRRYIADLLSANCFGDWQTRPALDVAARELLTFALLAALGGCEAQLKGHIRGNAAVGNDRATLLAVLAHLLPYIGYPRTLNAMTCLDEVLPAGR